MFSWLISRNFNLQVMILELPLIDHDVSDVDASLVV